MQWFFIALVAPFLWAFVNIADKYLVSKYSEKDKERSSGGLVLFSSLIGIFIAGAISIFTVGLFDIPILDKILLFITGIITIVWIVLYLFALEIEETSNIVPWFLSVPIFGYILGYIFLGEKLSFFQILGALIIFLGLGMISVDFSNNHRKIKKKSVFYMVFVCLLVSVAGIIFKYVTIQGNFWVSSFWEYFGLGVSGILIFIFIPKFRREFMRMNTRGGLKIFTINTISELLTVSGNLLTNFALLLAPVAMVYLVGSFQPAIVLLLVILGTKFLPKIIKEDISFRILIPKIVAIFVMILGSIILFL